MNPQDLARYRQAILNAQAALKRRELFEAGQWALSASNIAPDREEPWLLLAAVSKPPESIAYLQHALEINPQSERAARGMSWALNRLAQTPIEETPPKSTAIGDTQPIPLKPQAAASVDAAAAVTPSRPVTTPTTIERSRQPAVAPVALGKRVQVKPAKQKKTSGKKWVYILAVLILLLLMALVVWLALPAWMALARSSAAPIPGNMLSKPSLTPTATATFTPTPTSTSTPTPTNTPTPTATFTPVPTDTPWPTDPPTEVPAEPVAVIDTDERWIDIDLGDQMLYAFDGDELVSSFVVSTGTYLHPTVTGQYQIYVKYTYTDMRGDDYYLPDVPYTMYFYQGYGIHGTYWHNNFGTPMSHGCVNMITSDAEWLFNWSSVGTIVNVHD